MDAHRKELMDFCVNVSVVVREREIFTEEGCWGSAALQGTVIGLVFSSHFGTMKLVLPDHDFSTWSSGFHHST